VGDLPVSVLDSHAGVSCSASALHMNSEQSRPREVTFIPSDFPVSPP